MIYVCEGTPSKLLTKDVLPSDIECIFLELNSRKCKRLLVETYHSRLQNDQYFSRTQTKRLMYIVTMKTFYLQETLMQKSWNFVQTLSFTNTSLGIQSKKKHVLKTFQTLVALVFPPLQIMFCLFNIWKQSPQVHQIFISQS